MSTNTSKKTKVRIVVLIAQCAVCILFYLIFFFGNPLFFLILILGSVVVLSTGTIYTVIHHESMDDAILKKKQFVSKVRALEKRNKLMKEKEPPDIIKDYMNDIPSIQKYVESDKTYEDMPLLDDFIFTELSPEEIAKINRLGLSNSEKKQFIKEIVYFTQIERRNLIEKMIESFGKIDEEILYVPPTAIVEYSETLRVYAISLVKPGEKKKIIKIETTELVNVVKDLLADIFDYELDDFLLSTGGLIMNENAQIKDYKLEDKDEIVLIPSRKVKE